MDEEWLAEEMKDLSEGGDLSKRRSSHIRSCCVPNCTSKGYRLLVEGERVQYFQFPVEDGDQCKRWVTACRIPAGTHLDKAFVCSKHFRPNDFKSKAPGEKKSLRRTAVPSYESVVVVGKSPVLPKKKRKVSDSETTTDEEISQEMELAQAPTAPRTLPLTTADGKLITTLIQKPVDGGDNVSVVIVKSPTDRVEANNELEKHNVLANAKKVPLLLTDLLDNGPPYPWRKTSLDVWTTERLKVHEQQLGKILNSTQEEMEKIASLQEQIEARKELLALAVIKKSLGRMVLSQYLRTV